MWKTALAAACLAVVPVWAEDPSRVTFRTDPPHVQVFLPDRVGRGVDPSKGTSLGFSDEGVELTFKRLDQMQVTFRDPADVYGNLTVTVRPGFAVLPTDGVWELPALGPLGFLERAWRRRPMLLLAPLGVMGALAAYVVLHENRKRQGRVLRARARALGGDGDWAPIGEYLPLNLLGRGGYGEVYRAVHRSQLWAREPEAVALKLMTGADLDQAFEDEDPSRRGTLRERFRREATALEKLTHENIVRCVHHDLDGEVPYLAMELVNGETFADLLKRHPRGFSPEETLRLLEPVCRALHYAHSRNLLHRDLKPANLMVTREGVVKVMDFGLAYSEGEVNLTRSADWVGTPAYASPDSYMRAHTPALDEYAIGLIAYELLTGRPANSGRDYLEALQQALHDEVRKLSADRPDLGAFGLAVDRLYRSDASERYPDLLIALQELRAAL